MNDAYQSFLKSKLPRVESIGPEPGTIHPKLFDWQAAIVRRGVRQGRFAGFEECGLGKGQPNGSKILTPTGWADIEDLQIGQQVIASDGNAYPITGTYPKSVQNTYRVHFSDKSSFVVDEDHLHIVRTNNDRYRGNGWRVLSTKSLIDAPLRYGKDGKSRNYDIPLVAPVQFQQTDHWINPYVMGAILGDGCITARVGITIAEEEIVNRISDCLPTGWKLRKKETSPYDYVFSPEKSNDRAMVQELRRLGILGCYSYEKHIPEEYKLDSIENRVWLLRGLMDTDGYIKESSQFYSTSKKLADDVMFLVRSLGGAPTIGVKKSPTFTHNGEVRTGRDCYIVNFSLKTFNPFSLFRKAKLWKSNPRDNGRWIDRIEFEFVQPTVCIAVDSPDHSYVTEHFIVTHNTFQQIEWSNQICQSDRRAQGLIVCPLSVAQQTIAEATKLDIKVTFANEPIDKPGIYITNYQKLHRFTDFKYDFLALDESSILKDEEGKTRTLLIEKFKHIPLRSCWTATPSPNDEIELLQHAELLGIKSAKEARAEFFTHDSAQGSGSGYRLKKYAFNQFMEWIAEWAVWVRQPSDLGYSDDGFILPDYTIREEVVEMDFTPQAGGKLFPDLQKGIAGASRARRESLDARTRRAAEIIQESKEQWLVWCDLNDEGASLAKELGAESVLIEGKTPDDQRIERERKWRDGEVKTLITKTGMFGFGMNWQHAHKMIFLGLGYSYEKFKQAFCREYRFGQTEQVEAVIIVSEAELSIVETIKRKKFQAEQMANGIVTAMRAKMIEKTSGQEHQPIVVTATPAKMKSGDGWQMFQGDCVSETRKIADASIGHMVFSPPFSNKLYVFNDDIRDMSNCQSYEAFLEHFSFLCPELLRIMMPGRICAIHVQDVATTKIKDGVIGRKEFTGDVRIEMEKAGWTFCARITVDKNQQAQSIRTHALNLAFKQFEKDTSRCWPAMADYLMIFQKPGINTIPVKTDYSREDWIKLAGSTWYDINENDTLNYASARDEKDEAHLCPLQLEVIRRCVRLWSNPGETIFSPFAGIGSEGFIALEQDRRFVGIELKESYFKQAVKNLSAAVKQDSLFMEAAA